MEIKTLGVSGVAGSFSEQAALTYATKHGITANITYLTSVENVLSALNEGSIEYGIFPIENSTGGVVLEAIYAMSRHLFTIEELFNIEVVQNLIAKPGIETSAITEIVSHDQALKQCRMYLKRNFENVSLREYEDTAKAAEDLANGTLPATAAVIASEKAAKHYDLTIIGPAIQDLKYNFTSFLAVTKK
jgi:prephenate dehydratase